MQYQAGNQREGHEDIARFQRGKIAAALGKLPGLPGGQGVKKSQGRRQCEVALVAKAKLIAHQEVEVIEIKNRPKGIQSFERENSEFDFLARGHRNPETSSMALRQYHFTASDIGGCSLSKSPAEHQRMS